MRSTILFVLLIAFLFTVHSTTTPVVTAQTEADGIPLDADGLPQDEPLPPLHHQPETAAKLTDLASAESVLWPLVTPLVDALPTLLPIPRSLDNLLLTEDGQFAIIIEQDAAPSGTQLQLGAFETTDSAEIAQRLAELGQLNQATQLAAFNVELVDPQGGQVSFERQIRLALDLRELGVDTAEMGGSFYLAYQDVENENVWIDVPITTHDTAGLISADVTHFSNWAAGWRPEAWSLEWQPPSVSGFTGAAGYSYPIDVPPGRNGLQPSVVLSYSDQGLRGAIKKVSHGTIATGWSLSGITINRIGVSPNGGVWDFPEMYRLVINGQGGRLIEQGSGLYRVENMPGLRVQLHGSQHCDDPATYYTNSTPPCDNTSYWIVQTSDGTHYRLGYDDDGGHNHARTLQESILNEHLEHDQDPESHASVFRDIVAWHVDTVTDASGNQMRYDYERINRFENIGFTCPWGGFCQWNNYTHTSQVQYIRYNYPNRVTSLPPAHNVARPSGGHATRIDFVNTNPNDRLKDVQVRHGAGLAWTAIHRLTQQTLNYTHPDHECDVYQAGVNERYVTNTVVVSQIQHYGRGQNSSGTTVSYLLPTTTFSYETNPHFIASGKACFQYHYLSTYHNGYGASVEFERSHDGRQVGVLENCSGIPTGCTPEEPAFGRSYFITEAETNDGLGNVLQTSYSYPAGWCYDQTGFNGTRCQQPDTDSDAGPLAGFNQVNVTQRDLSGNALNQQRSYFHTTDGAQAGNLHQDFGKPYKRDFGTVNSTGGNFQIYSRVETDYLNLPFANGVKFRPTGTVRQYTYEGNEFGDSLSTKQIADYNVSDQDGAQYGKVTRVRVYDSATASSPYLTTRTYYRANTANWIITPAWRNTYDGTDHFTNLEATTRHFYDGNTNYTADPIKGLLTKTRTEATDAQYPTCPQNICERDSIETLFNYDGFGNVTSTTTYSDYGEARYNGSTNAFISYTPPASSSAQTTAITYDTTYNLYPLAVQNAKGDTTTFEIYGFDGVNYDQYRGRQGQLYRVTEPNGVDQIYEYDPFGRLYAVYEDEGERAGVDKWLGNPIVRYRYHDNTWNGVVWTDPANDTPFVVREELRPNDGLGDTHTTMTYFDGMGRPIQSRSRDIEVDTNAGTGVSIGEYDLLVTTEYGALGQPICQTAPYHVGQLGSGINGFDTVACFSKPQTQSAYDNLGRITTQTAPDSTFVKHFYSLNPVQGTMLAQHNIVNANDHRTRQSFNARGQLAVVTEFTGECGSYWGYPCGTGEQTWAEDAHTDYAYDALGNLTSVTDALNNTTTMQYDGFGRKTSMNDPDMGSWAYTYNAMGNLTEQQDANGDWLCFTYDEMNRITQKRTGSSNCTSTSWLATYRYGTSSIWGAKGLLREIEWDNGSATNHIERFKYDSDLRLVEHFRNIDGQSFTMKTLSFDVLDRPLQVEYPNGSKARYTYDGEGAQTLELIKPNSAVHDLVDNIVYNEQGQMTYLARDNNKHTRYTYYGATGSNGESNFRLQQAQTSGINDLTYQYDNIGNIEQVNNSVAGFTDNQTFDYDHLNRLISASATGGSSSDNYSLSYSYDKIGNMTNRSGWYTDADGSYQNINHSYNYNSVQPHAVDTVSDGLTVVHDLLYDNNGNMTYRADPTGTYTHNFDSENRLDEVVQTSVGTTKFSYDVNGLRVKTEMPDGTEIYTPFPGYEKEVRDTGSCSGPRCEPDIVITERVTLSIAGQTIAVYVKDDAGTDDINYLFTDHLGSSSVVTNQSGGIIDRAQYLPFGEMRANMPDFLTTITNDGYTGHKENRDIGLTYMNARFYVPGLARFASADTIVPNPLNPQNLNRFSYVLNSPIVLVDPTGHCQGDWDSETSANGSSADHDACVETRTELEEQYGIEITGEWTLYEIEVFQDSLLDIEKGLRDQGFENPTEMLQTILNGTEFERQRKRGITLVVSGICQSIIPICNVRSRAETSATGGVVTVYDGTFYNFDENGNATLRNRNEAKRTFVHEIGHVFDFKNDGLFSFLCINICLDERNDSHENWAEAFERFVYGEPQTDKERDFIYRALAIFE